MLAETPGVTRSYLRQAYLDASGLRIRSIEVAAARRATSSATSGRSTTRWSRSRPRSRRSTSSGCGRSAARRLQKARYSWPDGRFHWDVDFFKTDDGRTYFALAEVEMPETDTVPPPPPAILAPHVLLLAPRNDPRFTSKRLSDRGHAERLLADVRAKGEAA